MHFVGLCGGTTRGVTGCCGKGHIAHGGGIVPRGDLLAYGVADVMLWAMEEGGEEMLMNLAVVDFTIAIAAGRGSSLVAV
jgi:methyl coenzyme M reductase subunit C